MDSAVQEGYEKKERRRRAFVERHQRLFRLFKEDRPAFEREGKRMTQDVLPSVEDPEQSERFVLFRRAGQKDERGRLPTIVSSRLWPFSGATFTPFSTGGQPPQ